MKGLLSFLISFATFATTAIHAAEMNLELIHLQTLLEERISERYQAALGNVVEKGTFNLSVQVALQASISDEKKEDDPAQAEEPSVPPDFQFGIVDLAPDAIKDPHAAAPEKPDLFAKYAIRAIRFEVGVTEELGAAGKTQIEEWLKNRVTRDFGAIGTSSVSFIRKPETRKPEPPTWMDHLRTLQNLAGLMLAGLLVSIALVLGILIWSRVTRRVASEQGKLELEISRMPSRQTPAETPSATPAAHAEAKTSDSSIENLNALESVLTRIRQLATQLGSAAVKDAFRQWNAAGSAGKLKIAHFLEATTGSAAPIEIPPETRDGLMDAFRAASTSSVASKLATFQAIYWELIAWVNLGASELEEPFSYMDGASYAGLEQLLIDKNPRMQALVALHLPANSLKQYVKSLAPERLQTLIGESLKIERFGIREVLELDREFRSSAEPGKSAGTAAEKEAISVLPRLLDLINPLQEIQILSSLEKAGAPGLAELRKSYSSLAFLPRFQDAELASLAAISPADELLALIRALPELESRVVEKAPILTAQILREELLRPDTASLPDKVAHLTRLKSRLVSLLKERGGDLSSVYTVTEGGASTPEAAAA